MPKKKDEKVMEITEYKLHPIASAYPEMDKSVFEALKKSIKENGLRHPIVLMDGKIIDGKNRYLACVELGIEPRTVKWNGKGSFVDFVVDMNSNRRDLTKSQKAMIALELKKEYAKEAKERQKEHGGTAPGREKNTSDKSVISVKGSARALAAHKLGVSEGYLQQAETLCKEDEDLADFVKDGSMTLPQALKELEKRYPPKGIGEDVGRVFIELDLPANMYLSSVVLSQDSLQRHEFSAKIKFRNAETANIEALVKTVKMLDQVRVRSMTFRPITDLERRLNGELPPIIPGDQPRKIRKIQGRNNIMTIAPHGVLNDDKHTNIIVEEIAANLGCHAIINDVFPRSEVDFNRLDTLSKEMKTEFVKPITDFVANYEPLDFVANLVNPFIVLVHGCKNESTGKADILLGFGQGEPNRFTLDSNTYGDLWDSFKKRKIKVKSAKKGSNYCGWNENNLNQLFEGKVRSIQLEIKKTDFRITEKQAKRTGKRLAKVFKPFVREEEVPTVEDLKKEFLTNAPSDLVQMEVA